ncbi:MAG: phospholipase [Planctomycetota bacterium]
MSTTAAALRDLHHLLTLLADQRGRLERVPAAVRARKAAVAKLEADLAEARERVRATKLASDRKQLDLKSSEERISDWNGQLNTAASNKEYSTLQEQIAAAEMATSVLSDEILEMLERVDELEAAAGKAEQDLETGRDELRKFAGEIEEKVGALKSDIERLEAELAQAAKRLPSDFVGEYKRLSQARGAEGMAPSEGGVCDGCGQSITLNMQNELSLGAKPVLCQSCGALLYPA